MGIDADCIDPEGLWLRVTSQMLQHSVQILGDEQYSSVYGDGVLVRGIPSNVRQSGIFWVVV
jgi:hypothetical protein